MRNLKSASVIRIILLLSLDMLCAAAAIYLSVFVRFYIEYSILPYGTVNKIGDILIYWLPINLLIFASFRMYNRLWEFASIMEAIRVTAASFCSFIAMFFIGNIIDLTAYKSCYLLSWLFLTALTLGTRFFYRILMALRQYSISSFSFFETKNIMIIGAGHAGNALIREIERDRSFTKYKVVCLIDDDYKKRHRYIGGAKVVGGREKIVEASIKYKVDEIIFAIPSADSDTRHDFFNLCLSTSCVIKTLPSIYQMIIGKVSISMLRKVEISDLLERPEIELQLDMQNSYICGKRVLVTGAGGSIGSELCRQLAMYRPSLLIALDIYENSVYYVQNELKDAFPDLKIITLIGSVRDADRLEFIFSTYEPEIVYHAAAHKHVPLMEDSPNEAVKNNVLGTLNTVIAADKYGVSRFVMISTDKAVNPTNVMGATKRICEMLIQYYNKHSDTEFVAVRFGNVLGSNGSVIPIFSRQIEQGGPVTVTHPEVIRYFMTIPEAVSLVLQAGTLAKGGEIFVLDMGDPVRVLNLAENMIRLSGRVPYKDIAIEFTGLRPGEKIYEELLLDEEGITETQNKKIYIGKPINMDEEKFLKQLKLLLSIANDEKYDMRSFLRDMVPTYNYANIKRE